MTCVAVSGREQATHVDRDWGLAICYCVNLNVCVGSFLDVTHFVWFLKGIDL